MRKCYTSKCVKTPDVYIPLRMRFFAKDSMNILRDVTPYVKSYTKIDYKFNITLYCGTVVSFSYSTIVFSGNDVDVHLIVENYNK